MCIKHTTLKSAAQHCTQCSTASANTICALIYRKKTPSDIINLSYFFWIFFIFPHKIVARFAKVLAHSCHPFRKSCRGTVVPSDPRGIAIAPRLKCATLRKSVRQRSASLFCSTYAHIRLTPSF